MKQKRFLRKSINVWFLCLGVFLFSTGCLMLCSFDILYDLIIDSAMSFTPTSDAFKAWKTNDPPLIMDLYFFNWTNPEELYDKDSKPKFQQVGPYRFREVKEKTNITFNSNNTVSYSFAKYYYFMEDESPCQLDDVITTLNPVTVTAAYSARNWHFLMKKGVSLSIAAFSSIQITTTIDELLFTGFEDKFLSKLQMISNVQDRFGWFYKRNGTVADGVFNMYTKNDENFGKLMSWNYENQTDFFEGSCNRIEGSAGEFYPADRTKDRIALYSPEICALTYLNYVEDVEIKGIKAYKYTPLHLFDNGTNVPENSCFCPGECIPSGALNISACRKNAPIFLSLPHFYGADPYYLNAIEGLTPEKEKHEFYITLEPKSAITVDVAARMQINMLLQPVKYISMFENVPKVFFPIFFFDQVVPVTDELAPKIMLLQDLPNLNQKVAIIMVIVGGILTILAALLIIYPRTPSPKSDFKNGPKIQEELPLR